MTLHQTFNLKIRFLTTKFDTTNMSANKKWYFKVHEGLQATIEQINCEILQWFSSYNLFDKKNFCFLKESFCGVLPQILKTNNINIWIN